MTEFPLDPAAAAELRRLVGEILAEVLPGLRGGVGSGPGRVQPPDGQWPSGEPPSGLRPSGEPAIGRPASRPAVRPASTLTAGGIPSGVPAGRPTPTAMDLRRRYSAGDGPSPPAGGDLAGPASGQAARGQDARGQAARGRGTAAGGGAAAARAVAPSRAAGAAGGVDFFEVRVGTDAELREFALRVLRLADNPKLRRDLIAGRVRFRLAGGTSTSAGIEVPAAGRAVHRVDKGAVTERAVAAAAAAGAGLVLGPRAVLTPLARDKARALGVPIEKER